MRPALFGILVYVALQLAKVLVLSCRIRRENGARVRFDETASNPHPTG
jgi:hypothetical protein